MENKILKRNQHFIILIPLKCQNMAKLNDTFINRVCRFCDNLRFDTIAHKDAFPFDRKTSKYNLYCGSNSGNTVFVRGKVTDIDKCPRLH